MSLMAMSAGESVELRAARPPALSDPAKTPARISLSLGRKIGKSVLWSHSCACRKGNKESLLDVVLLDQQPLLLQMVGLQLEVLQLGLRAYISDNNLSAADDREVDFIMGPNITRHISAPILVRHFIDLDQSGSICIYQDPS